MKQDQIFPLNSSGASIANKLNGAFLKKLFVCMLTRQAMTSKRIIGLPCDLAAVQSLLRMKTLMILPPETPTMDTLHGVWEVWPLLTTSIGQNAR